MKATLNLAPTFPTYSKPISDITITGGFFNNAHTPTTSWVPNGIPLRKVNPVRNITTRLGCLWFLFCSQATHKAAVCNPVTLLKLLNAWQSKIVSQLFRTRLFGPAAEITAGPELYRIWSRISTDIPRHVNWVSNSQVKLPFSEGYISLMSAGDLFQMFGGFLRISAVPT